MAPRTTESQGSPGNVGLALHTRPPAWSWGLAESCHQGDGEGRGQALAHSVPPGPWPCSELEFVNPTRKGHGRATA